MERSCRVVLLVSFFSMAVLGSLNSVDFKSPLSNTDVITEVQMVEGINNGEWPAFSRQNTAASSDTSSDPNIGAETEDKTLSKKPAIKPLRALFQSQE